MPLSWLPWKTSSEENRRISRGSLGKQVQKKIEELKELILQQGSFPDDIAIDQPPRSGMRLPTEDARGQTNVKEQIWRYLMADVVGIIGVCGPGGIGKTTLMKNIHNDLLNESKFDKVIWAPVPYPVSVVKLQDNIASNMKQPLPENVTEEQRAATLSEILSQVRYVLILDDAWGRFSFEDVGIPKPTQQNGCKVVITSRSIELCNYIGCELVIRMQQLSREESLNLFLDTVGHDVMKIPNLEETLKLVVEECPGLPLAIVVIARSMRGENDILTWRYALFELRSRVKRVKGWDDEIFQRLKFNYDRLNDSELQNCFLDCSLYPKDFRILRFSLIESWIDHGLIEQLETRKLMRDRANVILNSLINKCLTERVEYFSDYGIRMHDVIREMALQVAGPRFMAKASLQLTEVPGADEWTENLEKVSLQNNKITDFASNMSPNCPKLSSLDFSSSFDQLRQIPDSFFVHMIGLKFLNLSMTSIGALPDSISILENLTVLRLDYCYGLRYMPSLGKLKALKKLDLKGTRIVKVPQGMELLVNLQHLNLCCLNLVELPMEILCNLTHLQFLAAILKPASFALKAEKVIRLKILETFIGQFDDLQGLNVFVKSCHQHQKFPRYWLKVGVTNCTDFAFRDISLAEFEMGRDYIHIEFPTRVECTKIIALSEVEIGRDDFVMLLNDFQLLKIENCCVVKSLSETTTLLKTATDLRYCEIDGCIGLEFMLDMFSSAPICSPFDKLEIIWLNDLPNLQALVKVEAEAAFAPSTSQAPTPSSIFSNLKIFEISKCPRIKMLFPSELLKGLQNLEKIGVEDCQKVEEIIEVKDEKGTQGSNDTITFTLPKLRELTLARLPKMKSICTARGVMVCDSLQTIEINDCPKLRRIPLYLPMLPNGKLSPPPSLQGIYLDKEMLKLLVWDNASAKDVILPFLLQNNDAITLQELFHDLEDFNNFVESFQGQNLSGYMLRVQGTNKDDDDNDEDDDDDDDEEEEEEEEEEDDDVDYVYFFNTVTFSGLEISGDYHVMLPNDLELLRIRNCSGVKSLDKTFLLKTATYLRSCKIKQCEGLECIIQIKQCQIKQRQIRKRFRKFSPFNRLSTLTLVKLPNLCELVKVEVQTVSAPSTSKAPTPYSIFPLLKVLKIYECPRIQKLFPSELLKSLQNLQQIYVVDCAEMEEIIAMEEEKEALTPNGGNEIITLVLPKLRRLDLDGLPKLKSICSARGVMVCDSLHIVGIFDCPMLNRIPVYLPLPPNGDLSPPPSLPNFYVDSREWWESLVWDNPSAKDILFPFLKLV